MRRRVFLAGAASLAGCAGHGGTVSPVPLAPAADVSNGGGSQAAAAAVTAAQTQGGSFLFRLSAAVMQSPILGEAGVPPLGSTPPAAWLPCDGRTLKIAQNAQLFAVLGKVFGGDGKTTFALPKATAGPYYIAVRGSQPMSPKILALWRKGTAQTIPESYRPDFYDGVHRFAPLSSLPRVAEPVVASAPVAPPDPSTISEHARFSQVLASLALDGEQRDAIAALTAQARRAPTGEQRRAAVEATMTQISATILRVDQRANVEQQMNAWRAVRRGA